MYPEKWCFAGEISVTHQLTLFCSPELYARGVPAMGAVWALLLWKAGFCWIVWKVWLAPSLIGFQALSCSEVSVCYWVGLDYRVTDCGAKGPGSSVDLLVDGIKIPGGFQD